MSTFALFLGFCLGTLTDRGMNWLLGHQERSIPWQKLILSILTGIMFYSSIEKFGLTMLGLAYAVLFALLIPASIIDFKWQIIPNRLILLGILAGVMVVIPAGLISLVSAAKGFLAGGLLMLVMFFLSLGRLGGGDIKLTAVIGLFVGWRQVLLVVFFSYLVGGLTSLFLLLTKRKKFSDPLPMGPFISLATVITVFWSKYVLAWYIKLYS